MQTHESSDGRDETCVEFCFDPLYWPMHDCYSTTYPNGSAFHAWRAGFREGVKMCLNQGSKPSLIDFKDNVHKRNMDHLSIWQNVGADVEWGEQAMHGARLGTYMTMLTDWNYTEVQWFDNLKGIYENRSTFGDNGNVNEHLTTQLDLPVIDYTNRQSKFFKQHYMSNWCNVGATVKEIDVIRNVEGW
jgi:hypothetical protein